MPCICCCEGDKTKPTKRQRLGQRQSVRQRQWQRQRQIYGENGKFPLQQLLAWGVPCLCWCEGDKTKPTKRQRLRQRQRQRQRPFGKHLANLSYSNHLLEACLASAAVKETWQNQQWQRQRIFGGKLAIFSLRQSLAWGVPCLSSCVARPHLHYNLTESQTSDPGFNLNAKVLIVYWICICKPRFKIRSKKIKRLLIAPFNEDSPALHVE